MKRVIVVSVFFVFSGCGGRSSSSDGFPDGADVVELDWGDRTLWADKEELHQEEVIWEGEAWQEVDADGDLINIDVDCYDAGEEAVFDSTSGDAEVYRLFSFAIVTDPHIGEGVDDFGSAGYNDSEGVEDEKAEKLRDAVEKINSNIEFYDIAFVMALGDFTDSGERSEYEISKMIHDELLVPYFPVIGNHDMWPYCRGSDGRYLEADSPCGDEYFQQIFYEQFSYLESHFADFVKQDVPVFNSENNCWSYFINYAFSFMGYHFICLDFVSRNHAMFGYPGVGPEADLFDFDGGSWRWFTEHLDSYPDRADHNILIFLHHPPLVSSFGVDSFSISEYNKMNSYIRTHGYGENIFGFFAGHWHRNFVIPAYDGQWVVVTAAAKDDATVRIVQIFSDGSIDFAELL